MLTLIEVLLAHAAPRDADADRDDPLGAPTVLDLLRGRLVERDRDPAVAAARARELPRAARLVRDLREPPEERRLDRQVRLLPEIDERLPREVDVRHDLAAIALPERQREPARRALREPDEH